MRPSSEIDAQIAELLAEKARAEELEDKRQARRDKEAAKGGQVLVANSPARKSPRKAFLRGLEGSQSPPPHMSLNPIRGSFDRVVAPKLKASNFTEPAPPVRSSFLSSLPSASASSSKGPSVQRSTALAARPALPPASAASSSSSKSKGKARMSAEPDDDWEKHGALGSEMAKGGGKRGDDLTIVEHLERGPKEFGAGPDGDRDWKTVEPNSGLRLKARKLSHDLLQDHLADRYHVPPSTLYSIIRLSRDGTAYDIPLEGDWITIAVVAEQIGPIRMTKGGPAMGAEASDDEDGGGADAGGSASTSRKDKNKQKKQKKEAKPTSKAKGGPRKFISFRLVTLPTRSSTSSSSVSSSGGDATLTMLLFEADSITVNSSGKRTYRGGSGGAFEKFWNVKIGSVVAIMNPRVLKPLKNAQRPHPLTNALAINPDSAESVVVIGESKDLGSCTALKRDGGRCGSWVDKRVSDVCEYHVHEALKKHRSGRAEFSASTSSMKVGLRSAKPSTSKRPPANPAYDPVNKRGLLPADTRSSSTNSSHGAYASSSSVTSQPTYIHGSTIVRPAASSSQPGWGRPEHTSEILGRNGREAVRKRKREEQEAEEEFLRLLTKDGGRTVGGKAIEAARAASKAASGKKKRLKDGEGGEEGEESEARDRKPRLGFTAEQIKSIGFDPTVRHGVRKRDVEKEGDIQSRAEAISLLTALTSGSGSTSSDEGGAAAAPKPTTTKAQAADELAKISRTLKSTDATKHRTSVRKPEWAVKADEEEAAAARRREEGEEQRGEERMVEFSDDD